jgi:hypothetical protein
MPHLETSPDEPDNDGGAMDNAGLETGCISVIEFDGKACMFEHQSSLYACQACHELSRPLELSHIRQPRPKIHSLRITPF